MTVVGMCSNSITVFLLHSFLQLMKRVTSWLIHYRSIIEKLGNDKMARIKILGMEEVKQSFYGQLVFGEGVASDLGEQLAKEARKAGKLHRQSGKISLHKLVVSLLPYLTIRKCIPLYCFGPVSAEEQRIAKEVASMLKLSVDIDTTSSEELVLSFSSLLVFLFLGCFDGYIFSFTPYDIILPG